MPSFPVAQCDWTRFFLLTWLQAFEYAVPNLYYLDLQTIEFTFLHFYLSKVPRNVEHLTHTWARADQLMKR